ncbi:MAG: CBS domain-containing protein [bacterium]
MEEKKEQDNKEELISALNSNNTEKLPEMLEELHAADLADIFTDSSSNIRQLLVDNLNDEQVGYLLSELDEDDRKIALDLMTVDRTSQVLENMYSDEAADILSELPTHEADELLERMDQEAADDVADLMRYAEDTAGGLMAKEFVTVSADDTVDDVLQMLRRHHDDAEMIYYLYAIDEDERLLGTVTLRKLIVCDLQQEIAEIMNRDYISVNTDTPQEEVAELVRYHNLLAVPVLDEDGRIQGIVTVDDVGDVVREEAAEELLEISGGDEDTTWKWSERRGMRTGILALLGGSIGTALLWLVSGHIVNREKLLLIPIVLVMAIITSSQSSLAVDMGREKMMPVILREILAGFFLSFISFFLSIIFMLIFKPFYITFAYAVFFGVWTAASCGAICSGILGKINERIGPFNHTLIVIVSASAGIIIYLLFGK